MFRKGNSQVKLDYIMTLLRSTKEVDYFTQLIYEALEIIENERQQEKTKENVVKI